MAWKVENPIVQSIGGGLAVYGVIKAVSNLTEKMPSVQAFLPTLGSVETPRIFGLEDTHQSTQAVNGFHEQDGVNGFDGHEDVNGIDGHEDVNGFDGHEDVNGFDGHEDVNGFDGHEDVNGFDGHEDVNGIDGWFDRFKKTRKLQAAQLAVARRMPRQQANQSVARPTPRAFSSIFGKFKPKGSLF